MFALQPPTSATKAIRDLNEQMFNPGRIPGNS